MKIKQNLIIIAGFLIMAGLCSCTGEFGNKWNMPYPEDDKSKSDLEYDDSAEQEENNNPAQNPDLTTGSLTDLKTFDIAFDKTPLTQKQNAPTDTDDPEYEDYVENFEALSTLEITWSGTAAEVKGAVENVTVNCDGADVTVISAAKGIRCILKGSSTDGMLSVYSDHKFRLDMDGLSLTNNDGPAINIQSGKRVYIVLSGINTLSDGADYAPCAEEDRKGTIFSEGQLCFSGDGTLDVSAFHKNGIVSDDYLFFRDGPVINVISSGTNGLKANDYITVKGGVLNVESKSAGGKCLSSDGYIRINGGRTTLMTTGGVDESDYSSSCCVKTDSIFVMNAGELLCKSTGRGGKGIKVDMNAYFNGGKVRVITAGADYGTSGEGMWGGGSSSSNTARPKGIRIEGKLFVNGGDIMVRVSSHEGIESKSYIEANGGRIMVLSYDDAINSAGELVFNNGHIYAQSTSNDGLDSNGNMTFNGGTVFAVGPSNGAECAIDVNEEGRAYITMNGGTVVGIGAGNSIPSAGTQCYCVYGSAGMGGGPGGGFGGPGGRPGGFGGPGGAAGGNAGGTSSGTISSDVTYSVIGPDSKSLYTITSPVNGSSMLISSPSLDKASSYTLCTGVNVNGGNDFCGLVTGAEVSGGSQAGILTVVKP